MFPTRTRAKQAAMATAANWFWNFMVAYVWSRCVWSHVSTCHSYFTPFITSAIGFSYGFIFAGCNLVAASACVSSPSFSVG